MRKREEIANPNSCFNKAGDDELMFVLLGRDTASPAAITEWVKKRIAMGKNQVGDEQTHEALLIAHEMDDNRAELAYLKLVNDKVNYLPHQEFCPSLRCVRCGSVYDSGGFCPKSRNRDGQSCQGGRGEAKPCDCMRSRVVVTLKQ